jgi:hypothetical protein
MAIGAIEAPEQEPPRLTGRALEIAVCKALGWDVTYDDETDSWGLIDPRGRWSAGCVDEADAWQTRTPRYLTDPAAAMGLVEEGAKRFIDAWFDYCPSEHPDAPWTFAFGGRKWLVEPYRSGMTFGEAVCRAFLAACEAEANQ